MARRPAPVPLPAADPDRELAELKAYLGAGFDEADLFGHETAMVRELEQAGSEEALYRTSRMYLYDLTVFAMSGTKRPYHEVIAGAVPAGARLLDFGCGIGSDGLALLEAGYDVAFADFANPSTAYLRWRLEQRGFASAPVYDLDEDAIPTDHALVWCFDVAEHVADPFALLARLEASAQQVLVNFLDPEPGETPLHHELPVQRLLRHCADRGLREYHHLHGRVHLVRYTGRPAGPLDRLRGRARLLRR